MDKFVLLSGYVEVDNQKFYLKLKNREVKERGGFIMIFLSVFLFASFRESFSQQKYIEDIGDYIQITLQVIGIIVLIYLSYYLLFKKKWSKDNYINDIKQIKIDKKEFETNVIICFNNKREKNLEFRNLENQLEPFLETLKKRNSRIEIKHL